MRTIVCMLGVSLSGISLLQCQPAPVVTQQAVTKTTATNARVAATDLPVTGYTLCYQQTFDTGTTPSASEWIYRTTDRLGGYNSASQVTVGNGSLNINYNYSGGNYYGGGVISTHTFGYGFYEVRCSLYSATPGLHQSFWTMGISPGTNSANEGYSQMQNDELPQYNTALEIDGFEQNSSNAKLACNHHVYTPSHSSSISQSVWPNPGSSWFTMGFEWRPDGITYYYKPDGATAWTQVATKSLAASPWNVYAPQNFWLSALPVPGGDYGWGVATPPNAGAAMKVGHFNYYAKPLPGNNLIGNAGFEFTSASTATDGYPIGWIESRTYGNTPDRSYVTTNATNANYGERYLVHESYSTPYNCTTKQRLDYIPYGSYKLTAWVRSSGGQAVARMRVIVGGVERYVNIPATSSWQQIAIDNIDVQSDDVVVAFTSNTDGPNQWIAVDSVIMVAK
ncbi:MULTISPECIES: family 16 glycosylhydrolase [unclassified Spirosoma]|uniref:family 16 glycosylhydrolase n=1 Tax=unclassified Spirosoma TaxID=2621999 RepID=UPI001AC24921|nr:MULTISPECIES: family 16 glycosylhydrolase [unclassified Spirosoma]MBN8824893.1 family 16 glycosylhydrolase [Spirosoma sp.]